VYNAITAELAVCLSLCVTREFASSKNLEKYWTLAENLGVACVQLLEVSSVGHYADTDVDLDEKHIQLLEQFYIKSMTSKINQNKPIIYYPGYHQRRIGCFGAGFRYLYIDAHGDMHACPFCQKKRGNMLKDNFELTINGLKINGCKKYGTASDIM